MLWAVDKVRYHILPVEILYFVLYLGVESEAFTWLIRRWKAS
jgi:hypothetical protein